MSHDFTGVHTIVQDQGLSMFHMLTHKGLGCSPPPGYLTGAVTPSAHDGPQINVHECVHGCLRHTVPQMYIGVWIAGDAATKMVVHVAQLTPVAKSAIKNSLNRI